MNVLGKQKKNDVPPETKAMRAKIILTILGVMALIVLLKPAPKQENKSNLSEIEQLMDDNLDSLIRDMGFEQYEVYYKGPIETLTQTLDCPEEDQIVAMELRRDLVENSPILTDKQKVEEIQKIMETIKELQIQVERFYANPNSKYTYDTRRIRFAVPDGRKFTFFEQTMKGLFRTRYLTEITDQSDNAEQVFNEIKEQNNESE